MKGWTGRKETMDLKVTVFDSRSPPKFITKTRAEPSNVKSCTPQPQRLAPPVDDVSSVSARLFPGSAKKVPLSRDNTETRLSAVLSNSNLGESKERRPVSGEYLGRGPLSLDGNSPRGAPRVPSPRSNFNSSAGRGNYHPHHSSSSSSSSSSLSAAAQGATSTGGWGPRQSPGGDTVGLGSGNGPRSPTNAWPPSGPPAMPMNGMILPPQYLLHPATSSNNKLIHNHKAANGSPRSNGFNGYFPPQSMDPLRVFLPPPPPTRSGSVGFDANCSPASADYYSPSASIPAVTGSCGSIGSTGGFVSQSTGHTANYSSNAGMRSLSSNYDVSPSIPRPQMTRQTQQQQLVPKGQYSSARVMPFPSLHNSSETAASQQPLPSHHMPQLKYGQEQQISAGAPYQPPQQQQQQQGPPIQSPPKRYRKDLAGAVSSGTDSRGPYSSNGNRRKNSDT